MKQKRCCLAFAFLAAIVSSSLLANLAVCDEPTNPLVNSTVTLGPEYSNSKEYWWIYDVPGGSTISIDISVQSGTNVDFYIKRGTTGEKIFERTNLQTLQENWVVPDTGNYICTLDNSYYGGRTSEVHLSMQKTAAQGGAFDPAPIVIIAVVLVVVLVSLLLILRMRKQPSLPPPPEEPPPPPA